MQNPVAFVCVAVALFTESFFTEASFGEDARKSPTTVKASDLVNGKCEIMGLLGKPYGTAMKVAGVWEGSSGANRNKLPINKEPFSLRILEVDGKKLATKDQVVIVAMFVKWAADEPRFPYPLPGEKVEGRVYEFGEYIGRPAQATEALKLPNYQGTGNDTEFVSFLRFFEYKSLGGGIDLRKENPRPIIRPAQLKSNESLPMLAIPSQHVGDAK